MIVAYNSVYYNTAIMLYTCYIHTSGIKHNSQTPRVPHIGIMVIMVNKICSTSTKRTYNAEIILIYRYFIHGFNPSCIIISA